MFCPRCGTEDNPEQRYCRRCGLSMPAVRAAEDGRLDESLLKLKSGETFLMNGIIALLIGLLNTAINILVSSWRVAVFTAVLGFVIGLSFIIAGKVKVERAKKILDAQESDKTPAIQEAKQPTPLSTGPHLLEQPNVEPPVASSVTEHTTLKLKRD